MIENQTFRPDSVVEPLGERLTFEMLPEPGLRRWVIRRKAEVVAAVHGGLLTFEEAGERYSLELEELASWERSVERAGMKGLRVTRLQHYRDIYARELQF